MHLTENDVWGLLVICAALVMMVRYLALALAHRAGLDDEDMDLD
jgi:hypothetical protein